MNKIYSNAAAALDGLLSDGLLIDAGGFGLCGIPELLIDAVVESGVKDLTVASNNNDIKNTLTRTSKILLRKILIIKNIIYTTSIENPRVGGSIPPPGTGHRTLQREFLQVLP